MKSTSLTPSNHRFRYLPILGSVLFFLFLLIMFGFGFDNYYLPNWVLNAKLLIGVIVCLLFITAYIPRPDYWAKTFYRFSSLVWFVALPLCMLFFLYCLLLLSALFSHKENFSTPPIYLQSFDCVWKRVRKKRYIPQTIIRYQNSENNMVEIEFHGHEYCSALKKSSRPKIILYGVKNNLFGWFLVGMKQIN